MQLHSHKYGNKQHTGIRRDKRYRTRELYDTQVYKVDKKSIAIGVVYGPNTTNGEFYRELKEKVQNCGMPIILGGDSNTVLDGK